MPLMTVNDNAQLMLKHYNKGVESTVRAFKRSV